MRQRSPEEGGDEIESPLARDLPCVACGYNLRGLEIEGLCPECGAKIADSLDYALERVLCPSCMRPNHPSMAICSYCKAPIGAAAAAALTWQVVPAGVPRKPEGGREEASKARSNLGASIAAIIFIPAGVLGALIAVDLWMGAGIQPMSIGLAIAAAGAVSVGIVAISFQRRGAH